MPISKELREALNDARILAQREGHDDLADQLDSIALELDAADSMDARYQRDVADRDERLGKAETALQQYSALYQLLRSGSLPGIEITDAEGNRLEGDTLDQAIGAALQERSRPKAEPQPPRTLLG